MFVILLLLLHLLLAALVVIVAAAAFAVVAFSVAAFAAVLGFVVILATVAAIIAGVDSVACCYCQCSISFSDCCHITFAIVFAQLQSSGGGCFALVGDSPQRRVAHDIAVAAAVAAVVASAVVDPCFCFCSF